MAHQPEGPVTIGGRPFALRLLTLGALKRVRDPLAAVMAMTPGAIPTTAQIDGMIAVVHASVVLSDPTVSLAAFQTLLDGLDFDTALREISEAFSVVTSRSGLAQKDGAASGEASPPGTDSSTSAASTGS